MAYCDSAEYNSHERNSLSKKKKKKKKNSHLDKKKLNGHIQKQKLKAVHVQCNTD